MEANVTLVDCIKASSDNLGESIADILFPNWPHRDCHYWRYCWARDGKETCKIIKYRATAAAAVVLQLHKQLSCFSLFSLLFFPTIVHGAIASESISRHFAQEPKRSSVRTHVRAITMSDLCINYMASKYKEISPSSGTSTRKRLGPRGSHAFDSFRRP